MHTKTRKENRNSKWNQNIDIWKVSTEKGLESGRYFKKKRWSRVANSENQHLQKQNIIQEYMKMEYLGDYVYCYSREKGKDLESVEQAQGVHYQ